LFRSGLLGLNDRFEIAVCIRDQSAISPGVCGFEAEHTNRGAGLNFSEQGFDRFSADQRDVAAQNDQIPVEILEGGLRLLDGMACAERRILQDNTALAQLAFHVALQRLCVGRTNDNDSLAADRLGERDRPINHRASPNGVQHFWQGGSHPRPLPRCQNHCGSICHGKIPSRWSCDWPRACSESLRALLCRRMR